MTNENQCPGFTWIKRMRPWGKGSTIFSSQFDPAGWHGKIGEGPVADAILAIFAQRAKNVKLVVRRCGI
jgi:hypothetical protein